MSSIVLDLQNEITSSDCDIINILRKAHIIAVQLDLKEFDQWISFELNGYRGNRDNNDIPDYRKIRGKLERLDPYHGWTPAVITDENIEKLICEHKIPNSISEIISLCNPPDIVISLSPPGNEQKSINEMFDEPLLNRVVLSNTAVKDIVEKVKNTVLEWTLRLEKEGILGEEMGFNAEEKSTARNMSQTIHNYYVTTSVINGSTENLQIVSGGNSNVNFTYEKARQDVEEIQKAIEENISNEYKETAIELLSEIRTKLDSTKKPNIIRAAMVALQDFLTNAGGNIVAALVQAKIHELF